MKKSGVCVLLSILIFLFFLSGCSEIQTPDDTTLGTGVLVEGSINVSEVNIVKTDTYDEDDVYSDSLFSKTLLLNLTDKTVTYTEPTDSTEPTGSTESTGSIESLVSGVESIIAGDSESGVTGLLDSDENVTITSTTGENIQYIITGSLTGTLTISSDSKYVVVLNGVTITSTDGPAIYLPSKKRVFIKIAENSTNILTDSRDMTLDTGDSSIYSNDSKAALFSKGQMIITGTDTGKLVINGDYKNCIYSKDYIRFASGDVTLNAKGKNAILAVNNFFMDAGNLTITGTGTTIDDETKGIKVEGSESEDGVGLGYIVINGGTLNINTISKGITASWDVDEDGDCTKDSEYEPNPFVEINSGTINITTIGNPYEGKDFEGNDISLSPEGIEGKGGLTINGGNLTLKCTDDCLNVSQTAANLVINGGNIYCISSSNDAIDSNGSLIINGGMVIASGTKTPECAFDCDTNPFIVNGGLLIGFGTSNYSSPSSSSTQNVIVASTSNCTYSNVLALCKADGTPVFVYKLPEASEFVNGLGNIVIFSSPQILSNETYTLYKGGTVTGTDFNNLYYGNISYTTGSAVATSSVTGSVTTIGSISGGGAMEGTPPAAPAGNGGFRW